MRTGKTQKNISLGHKPKKGIRSYYSKTSDRGGSSHFQTIPLWGIIQKTPTTKSITKHSA